MPTSIPKKADVLRSLGAYDSLAFRIALRAGPEGDWLLTTCRCQTFPQNSTIHQIEASREQPCGCFICPPCPWWSTFLHNHAHEIWACDFLPVTDVFFRSLFAFFVIELQSRKVVHVGVTRHPTDAWVAQQLREATPYGQAPRFLIRDNDAKFGPLFARVAGSSNIEVLKTPYHAPRANAFCERFLGSVRRECLDHLLILHEQQLYRILQAYITYFNQARPHQGLRASDS